MSNRTEPNKEQNESAIAELKRETRGQWSMGYKDARSGLTKKDKEPGEIEGFQDTTRTECYVVHAIDKHGNAWQIAWFPFDNFYGGERRETARIMAEELAERINEKT